MSYTYQLTAYSPIEGVEARSTQVGAPYWRKEFDSLDGAQAAVAELRGDGRPPYIWSYVKGLDSGGAFERLKA